MVKSFKKTGDSNEISTSINCNGNYFPIMWKQ